MSGASHASDMAEPIAIIGLGALMPKAASVAEFWANIVDGLDCIEEVPPSRWNSAAHFSDDPRARDKTYCRRGGFLPDIAFDPLEFGLQPNALGVTDAAQLLSLAVAKAAFADAGYPILSGVDHSRTAAILGVAGTTMKLLNALSARLDSPLWERALNEAGVEGPIAQDVIARIRDAYPEWDENAFPGFLASLVPGRIANRFDLGAASYAVDAACASSLCAIRLACTELASRQCDLALTGGVDTDNSITAFLSFSKTPALSQAQRVRPFDAACDGTLIAEGVGMLVLKRLSDATLAGDRVYAVIRGMGASTDGRGNAIYVPRADGQVRAIRAALAQAGLAPESIGLIEAHGTGTPVGDAVELEGLMQTYAARSGASGPVALGSVKSQIGHTKAAAGAASMIKAALSLYRKVLPPTLGVTVPHPMIADADSPFALVSAARPWFSPEGTPRRAAVSAFGFGGANYHAVLEEFRSTGTDHDAIDGRGLIRANGPSPIAAVAEAVASEAHTNGKEHAQRRREVRVSLPLPQRNGGNAVVRLPAKAEKSGHPLREHAGQAPGAQPETTASGQGGLVAVFSGQGSQYVGMGARLAIDHEAFRSAVERVDRALAAVGEAPCSAAMFPLSPRNGNEAAQQRARLQDTLFAQAAVGAFSMGAFAVLRELGLRPSCAIGHSFGELTALWAAGCFTDRQFTDLVVARGRSLSPPANADAGALLAIRAPLDRVEALLRSDARVQIANLNAPEQIVIGGPAKAIEEAEARFSAAGIQVVPVSVAAAFHTACVAYAREPWLRAASATRPAAPRIPVFANATAAPYPDDASEIVRMLGEQPFRPVRFRDQVEAAYAGGGRIFIEIGPKAVMTRLVDEILADRPHDTVAVNPDPAGNAGDQLTQAIGRLNALGIPLTRVSTRPRHIASVGATRPPLASTAVMLGAGGPVRAATQPGTQTAPAASPAGNDPTRAAVGAAAAGLDWPVAPASAPAVSATTPIAAAAGRQEHTPLRQLHDMQSRLAENHRLFLAGQGAIARSLLDPGMTSDPAALILLREVQESGASLHEQYMQDQLEIARAMLAGSSGASTPDMTQGAATRRDQAPETHRSRAPDPVPRLEPRALPQPDAGGDVMDRLRAAVGGATGYPIDFIEPTADLEADLGIDSVKRMEILSAFRTEYPNASMRELGRARSLAAIASLLAGGAGAHEQTAPDPVVPPAGLIDRVRREGRDPPERASDIEGLLRQIVADKTGYPADVLVPALSLEADLGIDSIKRVEIVAAAAAALRLDPTQQSKAARGAATLAELATLLGGAEVAPAASAATGGEVEAAPIAQAMLHPLPPLSKPDAETIRGAVAVVLGDGNALAGALADEFRGRGALAVTVGLLPPGRETDGSAGPHEFLLEDGDDAQIGQALDRVESDLGPIEIAILLAPRTVGALSDAFPVASAFTRWLRLIAPRLQRAAKGLQPGKLLAVTRLDGQFGFSGVSAAECEAAGIHAAIKTARREWPNLLVQAVDVAPALSEHQVAAGLMAELIAAGFGSADIGLVHGRSRVQLVPVTVRRAPDRRRALGTDAVVLLSGGGRGIGALCARALARETGCRLIVVGRTSPPSADPDWAAGATGRTLRAKAVEFLRQGGSEPTLRHIETVCCAIEAEREVRRTLDGLRAGSPAVEYVAADVADGATLAGKLAAATARLGPVTALVHAAGILADRRIEDIRPGDVDRIFRPKLLGLRNLLNAVDRNRLTRIALFSSSAAFFGNEGQAVYAMANEVLNKYAFSLARELPGARVLALDWGPWRAGMVTDEIAKRFGDRGIELLSPDAGCAAFLDLFLDSTPGPHQFVIGDGPDDVARATTPHRMTEESMREIA